MKRDATAVNLADLSFNDLLSTIAPMALEEVPEGVTGDPEALLRVDTLIGRFANVYAYMIYLHVVASNEVKRLKVIGESAEATLMIEKRDALYELARAVKLKHDAASRMITVHQESEGGGSDAPFDRVDYEGRKEKRREKVQPDPKARSVPGWLGVSG